MTLENQGIYTCTPFNAHGSGGPSGVMEVLVREPPVITKRPNPVYQRRIDDDVEMACEAEGTPGPGITWKRVSCAHINQLNFDYQSTLAK